MRNLKVTAMVAVALAGGLVLGGVGIAAAATRAAGSTPMVKGTVASMDTTTPVAPPAGDTTDPALPPSGDTTQPVTPPTGDTTQPVTPPSGDTTQPALPPTGDTTPTVCPAPRPPMPPQAHGHAYGRVISHPHHGLHRGQGHMATASGTKGSRHMGSGNRPANGSGSGSRTPGSMMGR
jgi:hypothetical protein